MFNVESLVPIAPWSKDLKFHGKNKTKQNTPCFHSSCSGGPKPKSVGYAFLLEALCGDISPRHPSFGGCTHS